MHLFLVTSIARENCVNIYQDSIDKCIYENIPIKKVRAAAINSMITPGKLDFPLWVNSYNSWEVVDMIRFLKLMARKSR